MLVETHKLTKVYTSGLWRRTSFKALTDADICIEKGETVGIFGKSGSGKTTLANIIAGIMPATRGEVLFKDKPVKYPFRGSIRKAIQMVYQHPEEAFDPRWTLRHSLMEPYHIQKIPFEEDVFAEYLTKVGLYKEHLSRKPDTLSGGELQRAALARVMVMEPDLIILDEPTSMLDSISQAQLLSILRNYQKEHGNAYLFITHNLDVMNYLCSRCYFLETGKIVKKVNVYELP